jgi:hypothetical protein
VGQCDAYKVNFCVICDLTFSSALLLTSEITAACDEFPATCRGGASRDCGAAAQKRIQRRCSEAMHAEHADASVRLQDRRSRIRYRRTRVAGIESRAEPQPCSHRRVLRASPCCICAEIFALRCRGPMLAHPLPSPRRRTRFWCYTLALRVYGAPVLVVANGCAAHSVLNTCLLADVLGRCEIWTGVRRSVLLRRGCRLGHSTRIVSEG